MSIRGFVGAICILGVAAATTFAATPAPSPAPAETPGLIGDGGFNKSKTSGELRRPGKGKDWYESRRDKKGHALLFLSTKKVGGNPTPKAMIKSSATLNTYLTQNFSEPQTGDFTVTFDILVKQILAPANHSAFIMIGDDSDKKQGPNSTGAERFVFMGFENAAEPGKINLIAREGNAGFDKKTVVTPGLALKKWHTIEIAVHPARGTYDVTVRGMNTQPVTVKAFAPTGKYPTKLTSLSFASWNDGPGSFYIDNVSAQKK